MRFKSFTSAMVLGATLLSAGVAQAQGVAGTNCTAPAGAFGFSGIPTTDAQCKVGGSTAADLYMSITQSYTSPLPTSDNAGKYFVQSGNRTGSPPATTLGFAKWNVTYATQNAKANSFFTLSLDSNPMTGVSSMTLFNFTGNFWDSTNMGYLQPAFNNMLAGDYNFRLTEYADVGRTQFVGDVAVNAVVDGGMAVVPEPSTYALMSAGLAGVFGVSRRRKNKNKLIS